MTSLTHCSVLAMTLVALPALASGDGDGCGFWLTDCPLPTYPLYLNENDTRGNLLMLLGMPSITPPLHPAGGSAERAQPAAVLPHPPPQPEEVEDPTLREQLGSRLAAYDPSLPRCSSTTRATTPSTATPSPTPSPRSARFWTPSSRARCPPRSARRCCEAVC